MTRSARIVPAILTDDATELARLVVLANSFAPFVQVDMMDGAFVPTHSIGIEDLRTQDIHFRWEAHLMVVDAVAYLAPLRDAGAARVIFHVESGGDPLEVVSTARSLGLGVGVALNPPTPVADVAGLLPLVDCVLLMTVYPGYYGAPFVPEVMSKVEQVRARSASVEIGVDGGVKEANLVDVLRHGVDTVCVGSAVFAAADPRASFLRLSALAQCA
ncbi:MAG: ribulose-phosphate 3-epimerase [Dehalococcoidia bacterium]|jgi:ribulose-phosphate 3-epimerase|nr:ribulose-phosphate 3-epimerase [Dehalococcoidia bacterium]